MATETESTPSPPQHTPAPWHRQNIAGDVMIMGPDEQFIARVSPTQARDANGALMEAAPDMLSTLYMALGFVVGVMSERGETDNDMLRVIEGTIAKATAVQS